MRPLEQIEKLIAEAKKYEFASVCVNPTWVSLCADELQGTDVKVCTVIGFPLGATMKEVKAFETKCAIEAGATEIDMVINVGAAKDGNWELVYEDIKAVVDAANGTLVKVIIETCLLTDEEKVKACEMSVKAGAHFVKTSTGLEIINKIPSHSLFLISGIILLKTSTFFCIKSSLDSLGFLPTPAVIIISPASTISS